jgi:hypothetical protein
MVLWCSRGRTIYATSARCNDRHGCQLHLLWSGAGLRGHVDISQQPDKAKLSSSVYVSPSLVVSRSQYSIRAGISDTKFPHVSRSWRRRHHRSSSTSNGNDISFSSTHDSDEDPNLRLSEHQLDSSPEPLQPQLQVTSSQPSNEIGRPCANSARLTRVPRFKLQVRVKTDHFSPIHPCPQPKYHRLRHLLHRTQSGTDYYKNRLLQKQSDVYTPPFYLWDYLREELLATGFDSHQELEWVRASGFLSIPVAVEKVIAFGTARLKVYT